MLDQPPSICLISDNFLYVILNDCRKKLVARYLDTLRYTKRIRNGTVWSRANWAIATSGKRFSFNSSAFVCQIFIAAISTVISCHPKPISYISTLEEGSNNDSDPIQSLTVYFHLTTLLLKFDTFYSVISSFLNYCVIFFHVIYSLSLALQSSAILLSVDCTSVPYSVLSYSIQSVHTGQHWWSVAIELSSYMQELIDFIRTIASYSSSFILLIGLCIMDDNQIRYHMFLDNSHQMLIEIKN